ncbi:MAG: PLP-dependent aminotransferase family protein [Chloroflexi bacterium]|nr:PLP-dependent aminotransferase family protein [Chloroflexota bacterium]
MADRSPLLTIDPSSDAALHRQVYDAIRSAILTGQLKPGDRLPPTRVLAEQLSLARMTVAEAYDQLQAEGYLQARQGSGTYVASNLPGQAPALLGDRSGGDEPPRLSAWGRHVTRPEYRALRARGEVSTFRYDFRPHRIAQDHFPWDAWRAAMDRAFARERGALLSYPPPAGHSGLVEEIAAHVRKHRAVSCAPDQIVVVNGSQQGLNLLAQLLLDGGDRAAVEDPGYPPARLVLEARGVRVTRVPVDEDGIVVDRLAAGPHRLVHVTPSHQDPTGATMSLGRRLALLDVAASAGCLIVEDDYDSEFRYEGRPVESLQGLDSGGRVVYAGTFSKSVLPGLRIGFLILPPILVRPFVTAKSLWDGGVPLLEQAALGEFMRSGEYERHIRRVRRVYRERRDRLVAALDDVFEGRAAVGERHGGLNVLVSLRVPLSEVEVARRGSEAGIGLRPASPYYARPPRLPTFLLGFGAVPPQDIRDGIRLLRSVVD